MPLEIARAMNPLIFIRERAATEVQTDGVLIVGNWTPATSLFSKDTQTPDDVEYIVDKNPSMHASTDTDDLEECFRHLSRELSATTAEEPISQADIEVLHAELFQDMHELAVIDAQHRPYTPIPSHTDMENMEVPPFTITHFGDGRAPEVAYINQPSVASEFDPPASINSPIAHIVGIDGNGKAIITHDTADSAEQETAPSAAPSTTKKGRNKVPLLDLSANCFARSSTD
jgi:hypothetical protein